MVVNRRPGPPRRRGRPRSRPPPVEAPPDLVELLRVSRANLAASDAKLRQRFGDAEFDAALRVLGVPVPRSADAPRRGRPPAPDDLPALYWIAFVDWVARNHPEYSAREMTFEKMAGIVADGLQVRDREQTIARWRKKYRYEGQDERMARELFERMFGDGSR